MLAHVNGWSETEKATFLAVSLRGSALAVLANLASDHRCNYDELMAALQKRFGSEHQAELHRAKLRSRTRRREESLQELLEDIERLVRLAYPDATPAMLQVLAKDQFIDALPDEEMRLRVRQLRPESPHQALQTALEIESYQLSSKQRSKYAREATVESCSVQSQRLDLTSSSEVLQKLQEVLEALQHSTVELCRRRSRPGGDRRGRDASPRELPSQGTCWTCGERGHYRWNCKMLKSPPESKDTNAQATRSGNEK